MFFGEDVGQLFLASLDLGCLICLPLSPGRPSPQSQVPIPEQTALSPRHFPDLAVIGQTDRLLKCTLLLPGIKLLGGLWVLEV
jgi:hypothetical protein